MPAKTAKQSDMVRLQEEMQKDNRLMAAEMLNKVLVDQLMNTRRGTKR